MTAALSLPPDALPAPPHDGMPVAEADYWAWYYLDQSVSYEWNNGILEEKGVSDYLTFQVVDWFVQLLIEYLNAQPVAKRVGLEMGFRMALPEKTVIRRPDYALVLNDNPVPLGGLDASYRGVFDVCIEGISTSSRVARERDTLVKKGEYAAAGVREYYLLHHRAKLRAFYRLAARGHYEPMPVMPGGILCSEVLPGFQWRLRDLERLPSLEELASDPVYRAFVWLPYQQQCARADAERARADAERARADAERARADRLAARLRALGLDPATDV